MEHPNHRPSDWRQQDYGHGPRRHRPDGHEGRVGELSSATRGGHGSVAAIIRSTWLSALLLTVSSASSAYADSLVVMWDQNPEPNVTAYRVFVGTSAGSYSETFDVPGGQTSFVYSSAVRGRRYYVAVAAQVDDPVWGPRSSEASGTADTSTTPGESSQFSTGLAAALNANLETGPASDPRHTREHRGRRVGFGARQRHRCLRSWRGTLRRGRPHCAGVRLPGHSRRTGTDARR